MSAGTERRIFDASLRPLAAVTACCAALASFPAFATDARPTRQPVEEAAAVADPDAALEAYLDRMGLRTLLAEHLAQRIPRTTGPERKALAERLSRIYVELLAGARTTQERQEWEVRSRELLRSVPDAESYELRLNLARVVYITAEDIVERGRLRLASEDDLKEAERILRTIGPELSEIASRLHGRVDLLERQEERGNESETLSAELSEARRLRSLAFYYSGWTEYSLAYLSNSDRLAANAMKSFGWLLNSRGGIPASLERLPTGLLKYEHVARAAVGCALCASIRGNDVEAIRWLDAVGAQPDLAHAVREQLLSRRISILAAARRWADLERTVRVARRADRTGGGANVQPLAVAPARLLAVVTLEADKRLSGEILEQLAAIALHDLVTRGEVAQVLDLVQRYGTAPIGDKGFVVNYVRGIQAYESAREAHRESGEEPDEPLAGRPEVIEQYRRAATLLDAALREPDAGNFGNEGSRAGMLVGLALFYASDFLPAAERFIDSARAAASPGQGEEPLWLAVLALDRAVRAGHTAAEARRSEMAALFLQLHPQSPRAARLLVSLGPSGLMEEEAAVRILLGVPRDAPMYEPARRESARLLYALFRRARSSERDFAATRFLGVAEEVLQMERRTSLQGGGEESRQAAERAVLRVRQILDAVLSVSSPDAARAEAALRTLDEVVAVGAIDISVHNAELTYRRIQLHMARQQFADAERLAASLDGERGPFADAARRLLFRAATTALDQADRSGDSEKAAEAMRNIIRYGQLLLERAPSPLDAAALAVHGAVADAAARLWDQTQDESMRSLAIRMDDAILDAAPRTEAALRRVARLAEAGGDVPRALDCWRILVSAFEAGTPNWYEARYHSIRLLARTDADRAREAMRQHRLLYPSLGPPPWDAEFLKLEQQLGTAPASSLPPVQPPGGGS